uniref:WD_REPEATS_REGION domain-containing protein n=1 Tax=Glossina pallidipes TaxID=7398 RepID=A0A1B0AFF9_GLOPL
MNSDRNVDPYVGGYFVGHTRPVIQVRFSPDGSAIATNSADSTVVLWDLKSVVRCPRFSEHAKRDGFVNIWEPKAHCICQEFLFHDKPLRSVDFHPTGPSMLVAASDDKSVKLWQIDQKKFITSFASRLVRSAKFSPNGQLIVSCGDENSLRIFDMKSGERVWCLTEEKGLGRQLAWHPNGNIVAVALSCCRVKVFDRIPQELVQLYQVYSEPAGGIFATKLQML